LLELLVLWTAALLVVVVQLPLDFSQLPQALMLVETVAQESAQTLVAPPLAGAVAAAAAVVQAPREELLAWVVATVEVAPVQE
jgi:hypothetical protein